MALIGYARVSTQDQNLDSQIDALKAVGCKKIFVEKVSGGKSADERPELAKALAYLRGIDPDYPNDTTDVDTLVVLKFDRLARSLRHLLNLVGDLRDRGIGFRSLEDNIDTSSPTGQLMFNVMGSFSEFTRDLIRANTVNGLASARARGRIGGRPKALDAEKEAIIDRRRSEGVSVAKIGDELGIGVATVYRYLKDQSAQTA